MRNKILCSCGNVFLAILFIVTSIVIISPLLAEVKFMSAERCGDLKLWSKALAEYEFAIRIDPWNSHYAAGFGKFLLINSSNNAKDIGRSWIETAETMYKKALLLNPFYAEYALGLGQAEFTMYLKNEEYPKKIAAFENFEKAINDDPHGFNTSYSVGYAIASAWPLLKPKEKDFAMNMLRISLDRQPNYGKYIYPLLWKKTKDFIILESLADGNIGSRNSLHDFIINSNLWKILTVKDEIARFYRRIETPHDMMTKGNSGFNMTSYSRVQQPRDAKGIILKEGWRGKSFDSKNVIENGMMFWDGTISGDIAIKKNPAKIYIYARKFLVIKTDNPMNPKYYPYMVVRFNGKDIGEVLISNDDWEEYIFPVETNESIGILSISFTNDIYDPKKNEDRNLEIGQARVVYE